MKTLGVKRLIEQVAYELWEKDGKPEFNKNEYYWSKAEKLVWEKLTDRKKVMVELKDLAVADVIAIEKKKSVLRKTAYIEFECILSAKERYLSVWCKDMIDFNLCQHCTFLKILNYKEVNVQ